MGYTGNLFFFLLTDRQKYSFESQGSLYLECIPKDGLFHKMLLLSLMEFLLVDVICTVSIWG